MFIFQSLRTRSDGVTVSGKKTVSKATFGKAQRDEVERVWVLPSSFIHAKPNCHTNVSPFIIIFAAHTDTAIW